MLLTLDRQHTVTSITLTNGNDVDKVFQAEPVLWQHKDGQDIFQPTTQLIVSPPMFRMRPGARQIVRIGLAEPDSVAADSEGTYRLFLEEIPQKSEAAKSGVQLNFLLRLSLPLFIQPKSPAAESLSWSAKSTRDGIVLQVHNNSNVHARISALELLPQGSDQSLRVNNFIYLFAGETHSWTLKPAPGWHGSAVKLTVNTDLGAHSVELPLQGG